MMSLLVLGAIALGQDRSDAPASDDAPPAATRDQEQQPAPVTPPPRGRERSGVPIRTDAPAAVAAPQPASAPTLQPPRPAFRPINHDEDYSVLADPALRTSLWRRLKHVPVAQDSYLTLGGELRLRPEWREGERWGRGPQDDDGDFQQRTRVWADLQLGGQVRGFVDIQHATSHSFDTGINITEEGRADFNQAFVEAWAPLGDATIRARVGRQEVGIGGFRLFDMREGANTRRSLDLARVMVTAGRWNGEFLTGYAVRERLGAFDDGTNRDYSMIGAQLGRAFGGGPNTARAELFYVHTRRTLLAFDTAPRGRDERHTLSLRHAGRAGPWDHDAEAIVQRGSHGDLSIRAWYVSAVAGHNFDHRWRPRAALRVDVGSGDRDPGDGVSGTYGPLFPRPLTYNGDLGPQNQIAVTAMATAQFNPRTSFDISTAGLWRTSVHDAVYALSGQVLRRADESDSRYIGQRFTAAGRYAINPFTTLGVYVNWTLAGEVFRDSGTAENLLYAAPYLTFRF